MLLYIIPVLSFFLVTLQYMCTCTGCYAPETITKNTQEIIITMYEE